MASSLSEIEPIRDINFYKELAQRDLELIESQRDEIGRLNHRLNDMTQQRDKYRSKAKPAI